MHSVPNRHKTRGFQFLLAQAIVIIVSYRFDFSIEMSLWSFLCMICQIPEFVPVVAKEVLLVPLLELQWGQFPLSLCYCCFFGGSTISKEKPH